MTFGSGGRRSIQLSYGRACGAQYGISPPGVNAAHGADGGGAAGGGTWASGLYQLKCTHTIAFPVSPAGVEPAAFGSGGRRSIQLSYGRILVDSRQSSVVSLSLTVDC